MRTRTLGAVVGLAVIPAIALTACGPSVSKTTTPPPATHTSAPPAPGPASSTQAPPESAPNTGPLGTSYEVKGSNNSGNDTTYTVTAIKVDQHSALTPYDTLTNPSDHLAAVEFKISGVSGQSQDNANLDAAVLTGNTQQVSSALNDTPNGGNWNYGDFSVAAGQSASGWVTFELPPGQSVASVMWTPGFSGDTGTWTVG